jgi:hypothetical protein
MKARVGTSLEEVDPAFMYTILPLVDVVEVKYQFAELGSDAVDDAEQVPIGEMHRHSSSSARTSSAVIGRPTETVGMPRRLCDGATAGPTSPLRISSATTSLMERPESCAS